MADREGREDRHALSVKVAKSVYADLAAVAQVRAAPIAAVVNGIISAARPGLVREVVEWRRAMEEAENG